MKNIIYNLFFLSLLSCSSYKLSSSNLNSKISFNENTTHKKNVRFKVQRNYFLWGKIPAETQINVSKEVEDQGFDEFSSFEMRKVADSSDTFWSILSLGLYIPQTYEISGRTTIK